MFWFTVSLGKALEEIPRGMDLLALPQGEKLLISSDTSNPLHTPPTPHPIIIVIITLEDPQRF